jgi:hypothetical protein
MVAGRVEELRSTASRRYGTSSVVLAKATYSLRKGATGTVQLALTSAGKTASEKGSARAWECEVTVRGGHSVTKMVDIR